MKIFVNGVNYYYNWLKEYQKNRETLVCLHGFTGSTKTFHFLKKSTINYNVLTIDLLGHGFSDCHVHPSHYQMENQCLALSLILSKLNIEKFSVFGYSMGARVALSWAYLNPHRMQYLFLEGGSPGIEDPVERQNRRVSDQRLAAYIREHSMSEFVNYWENMPLFDSQKSLSITIRNQLKMDRLRQNKFGLICSLWYLGTGVQPSLWQELANLQGISVHLLVGETDEKFKKIAQKMQEKQSSFYVHIIADAGHCAHLENPNGVIRVLQQCFEGE